MHNEQLIHPSLSGESSEEVTHIIDNMPATFGLIVSLLVFILVFLTLTFGWLIKYPEVLKGQIMINGGQAPVKLVTNASGRIQLLLGNSRSVKTGQYIAVISNAAEVKDVQILKNLITNIDIHHVDYAKDRYYFPENLSLGELNSKYFSFLGALYQYLDYYHEMPFDQQKSILEKSVQTQQDILGQTIQQFKKEHDKFALSHQMYQRDSILYVNKVLTKSEFETASVDLISKEQQYKTLNKDITGNKYQIEDTENKIGQLAIQRTEKENQLDIDLINSYHELSENILQWEHKYVLISPINGKLDLLNFWNSDDFVDAGKEIFAIIPIQHQMIGQVQLPEQGAGKVKIGQDVIIKLDNYPYAQYGSIRGKVKYMSLITNEQTTPNAQKFNSYLVTVSLPSGLKTNYGTNLAFHFEAKGTAEIVTNDERLMERLFDNLKHETH